MYGAGLRVSGEVDLYSRRELGRVLAARLAAFPQLELEVTELSFADLSAVRELFLATRALSADGLITLVGAQPLLRRVIDLASLHHPG